MFLCTCKQMQAIVFTHIFTPLRNTYLHALSTTAVGGGDDVIVAGTTAPGAGGVGSGTDVALIWEGLLITAGTSGTLRLQWAQLASFATGTSVLAGSKLILQRIG